MDLLLCYDLQSFLTVGSFPYLIPLIFQVNLHTIPDFLIILHDENMIFIILHDSLSFCRMRQGDSLPCQFLILNYNF